MSSPADDEDESATQANAKPPPPDLGLLPSLIGYALRRAQTAMFQDFYRTFAEHDISPAQFSVLIVLRHNPGLRQSRVSDALGIQRTNFVPLFDALARRGLVERRAVPGDRRASALFLTEAGAALLHRLEPLVASRNRRFVARIGGEEGRRALLDLLHRLRETPAEDV